MHLQNILNGLQKNTIANTVHLTLHSESSFAFYQKNPTNTYRQFNTVYNPQLQLAKLFVRLIKAMIQNGNRCTMLLFSLICKCLRLPWEHA